MSKTIYNKVNRDQNTRTVITDWGKPPGFPVSDLRYCVTLYALSSGKSLGYREFYEGALDFAEEFADFLVAGDQSQIAELRR